MIKVLFFGPVADRVGARQIDVAHRDGLRWQDVRDELRAQLQARHPEAFALVSLSAIDGVQVRDASALLNDGSEVVFMSKFSGG